MALSKTKTLSTGLDVSYHRIIHFHWDVNGNESVKIAIYKDSAARDALKDAAQVVDVSWDATVADGYLGADGYQAVEIDGILAYFYAKLKENDLFYSDATDV